MSGILCEHIEGIVRPSVYVDHVYILFLKFNSEENAGNEIKEY